MSASSGGIAGVGIHGDQTSGLQQLDAAGEVGAVVGDADLQGLGGGEGYGQGQADGQNQGQKLLDGIAHCRFLLYCFIGCLWFRASVVRRSHIRSVARIGSFPLIWLHPFLPKIIIPRRSRGFFFDGHSPMLLATCHVTLVRSDTCISLLPAARKRASLF